ncbi:hypothetical protein N865_17035 [Intrasporangium oryzae NRRL B-24470]|uniref:Uncharacterized protein n=1 Tax=Intrasporangium oryzae NRRL B-24470 TaxID=1386089 RepID=W9GBV5_9MICO|nr:hypothetical protein [Intrasporangium oryzae]EWT03520.1 hypothetical protein N865_17035 [Intrasporangium oryzae NRRL B-24470]
MSEDDPWGLADAPAVAVADLEPLPAVLAEIAAALDLGERIPVDEGAHVDRPSARDLPEVDALVRQGWEPLPVMSFGSDLGLLPVVWPVEHRCWLHDRVPAFGVCSYGPGETYIEPDMRNPQRQHWELARTARSLGLAPPPGGRLWLLRSPWEGISTSSLLLAIRQRRDADGLGWDAVAMLRAAEQVLEQGEATLWETWSGRQADAARAWRLHGSTGADVDRWIRLGLGPEDLTVLTSSPADGGAGLAPDEVRDWCAAVTTGGEPRDEDVARIIAWRRIGLPSDAPVRRLTGVMFEREPAHVRAWLEAGLTVGDIVAWEADDLSRALRWREAGIDAQAARALTLADPTLTPEEAQAFDAVGIERPARLRWVEAGFSAAEARAWTDVDVVAAEARVWRSLGKGPDDARAERASGGGALPLGVELGWASTGAGRDDVNYGVTDPPGTRGQTAAISMEAVGGTPPFDPDLP